MLSASVIIFKEKSVKQHGLKRMSTNEDLLIFFSLTKPEPKKKDT